MQLKIELVYLNYVHVENIPKVEVRDSFKVLEWMLVAVKYIYVGRGFGV